MSKTEKFIELLKDKEVAAEIATKQSAEEVKEFLNEKGLDCSLEDVKKIGKYLSELIRTKSDEELSESELENVAGGEVGWPWEDGHFDSMKKELSDAADSIKTTVGTGINLFVMWVKGW